MAKDTRGLDENKLTKKDIADKQQASDAKIVSTEGIKPLTNEDGQRLEGPVSPAQIAEANKLTTEGNAERLKDLPVVGPAPKNPPVAPDPVRPKLSAFEELTPGQEAKVSARKVGTGIPPKGTTTLDFGTLPKRPEGASSPASVNVTEKADVANNLLDRLKSGMGLPGEEKGILSKAVSLHENDRQIAVRTGKVVNGVSPNDPKSTELTVFGGHHHRLAKVMNTFGISDTELYTNAASAAGMRLETHIHALHKVTQKHEDSKRQITHYPKEGDLWEHPDTKKLLPVSEAPMEFTRTKGKISRVTRGPGGEEIIKKSHEGWDPIKVAGGKTVYRKYSAPVGIDLVDHLRVQMLNDHGPSATSRKKSKDVVTTILDAVSGRVPKDKMAIGKKKVPAEGGGETYSPILVDKPNKGRRADEAPFPPKAKKSTVLKGIAPLDANLSPKPKSKTNTSRGAQTPMQLVLPGTGEPKTISYETKPAVYKKIEGTLSEQDSAIDDLSQPLPKPPKGSGAEALMENDPKAFWESRENLRKAQNRDYNDPVRRPGGIRGRIVEPAKYDTEIISTNRPWIANSNKGKQFVLDTTDMTGAEEVKAISNIGELESQKKAGTAIVKRPGGKAKAKRDRDSKKNLVQPSLFPDFSVTPGRSNQFYMAGSVQPISEISKKLQEEANTSRGSKEPITVSAPVGSREEKKTSEEINKKLT